LLADYNSEFSSSGVVSFDERAFTCCVAFLIDCHWYFIFYVDSSLLMMTWMVLNEEHPLGR
jgi:hypothetical protein